MITAYGQKQICISFGLLLKGKNVLTVRLDSVTY
jgi:hypothetical protein